MDLFTGKKIADLRKFNSLSQEALAEKMGVSRQAVSKWERGEASPDMDNIIALAAIFNVSVDDLLGDKKAHEITDFNAVVSAQKQDEAATEKQPEEIKKAEEILQPTVDNTSATVENIGIATATEEIADKKDENENIKKEPVKAIKKDTKNPEKPKFPKQRYMPEKADLMKKIPVFLIVPLLYIMFGIFLNLWHPMWIMFFLIPIYYLTIFALDAPNLRSCLLRMPVHLAAIMLFLIFGFATKIWHPTWFIILLVPVYYWCVGMMKRV